MYKNIIIGILLAASAALAYLYETEKKENDVLNIEVVNIQSEKSKSDSLTQVFKDKYNETDSILQTTNKELAEVNWAKEDIEFKYDELYSNLHSLSNDSVAQFIVNNYLGSTYKIQKYNDTIFIAFEEITTRDIIKKTLECQEIEELYEQSIIENRLKDTLIIHQLEAIDIFKELNDKQKAYNDDLLNSLVEYEMKFIELEDQLAVEHKAKWISIGINGVLILLLIAL